MIDLLSTHARRRYSYYLHTLSNGERTYAIVYIDEKGKEKIKRYTTNLTEAKQFVENINGAIARYDAERTARRTRGVAY